MRIKFLDIMIISVFLFILFGIFNLEVVQSKKYKVLSDKNCIRLTPQAGARGKILDRQGMVIAGNYLSYDVLVLPENKNQADKTLSVISGVLGIKYDELKDRFKKGYVAKSVPVCVAKNISIKKTVALEELKFDYGNIIIQPHPLRYYPFAELACHVIGYINEIDYWRLTKLEEYGYKTKDIVGFGGVEEKYDYYLRQEDGALSVEVDHRGRFVRLLGFRPPKDGKDIQLTLDLRVQKIVEQALESRKGSVVLMDPNSGEIIAMASRPNFNPAIFVDKAGVSLSGLGDSALVNRAISSAFPPGSVFKLIVASAGLETGKINLVTTYTCTGSMQVGNRQFNCWSTHGPEDLAQAIAHSCDIFFYRTGLLIGPQAIHDYALKFGLSKPTGIDLPYEVGGFVPEPLWKRIYRFQNWFDGDTANFSIGQGDLLVTPIQTARLMAVFANQGTLVNPYIIKNVAGNEFFFDQKKCATVAVKNTVINYVREDLKKVTADVSGTANVLSGLPVAVAGKTGTSQVAHGRTHGWFAGFFPFNNPRYVICVFLENNGSGHSASIVTRQIIEGMIEEKLI